ncbi:FAD/NAD(P)-binding domain-containing protein [Panus rudis PR-1116 ss-1]|nr:FAD/NAD(P)-binding domain-containing protein [Panus rudis PR-1116 ss-1]
MSSQSKTRVIIAGCGIAGPVLAIILKQHGYDPVIYERVNAPPDSGIGLSLQTNGLRALSQIPGLVEGIPGRQVERILFYSVVPGDEGKLAEVDLSEAVRRKYGLGPTITTQRPAFHRYLVKTVEEHGVTVHWGHQLVRLQQGEDEVTVTFQNGETAKASFVVGCDGLHSDTRATLFGRQKADFTGVVQVGGTSLKPNNSMFDSGPNTVTNVFGDGAHLIAFPSSSTQVSWATTLQEPEARESWKMLDQDAMRKFKAEAEVGKWEALNVKELVHNTDRINKYGIYDRPELENWHVGRVVLLGDAAHPTSPYLGQGANQAFEDIGLLAKLLKEYNPKAAHPSTGLLDKIFTEYETVRIPCTSALVKEARRQGELRVAKGVEACKKRNDFVRELWKDEETVMKRYAQIYKQEN